MIKAILIDVEKLCSEMTSILLEEIKI